MSFGLINIWYREDKVSQLETVVSLFIRSSVSYLPLRLRVFVFSSKVRVITRCDASDMVLRLERADVSLFCGRQSHESRLEARSSPFLAAPIRGIVVRYVEQVYPDSTCMPGFIIRWQGYGARVQGCRFQSGPIKLAEEVGWSSADPPRP